MKLTEAMKFHVYVQSLCTPRVKKEVNIPVLVTSPNIDRF